MNRERFNALTKEEQNIVFDEMCEMYKLVTHYAPGVEEYRIFAEWATRMGRFGEDMRQFLLGIYPPAAMDIDSPSDILLYSERSLAFVKQWNDILKWESNRRK